jgi:GT2 family glycosyltransferase
MLIRRAAINALPGGVLLDPAFFLMYEDVDLCKRLGDAGFVIWYWPDAHIVHLGGQSTRQHPILTYATSHVSALTYFRKHHPRAVPWLRAILCAGMNLKIALLRLHALRRPRDNDWTQRHLAMARAARRALLAPPPTAP